MNLKDLYDNITEMRRRIETISNATNQAVAQDADEILSLRKDEILLGRNSDGEPFTPGYLSDPYFNDPNRSIKMTAVQYAEYKYRAEAIHAERISHVLGYPNKDPDTPNIRFTLKKWRPGENFQDSMFINVNGDTHEIGSYYKEASLIDGKYDHKVFPLGPEAKAYFWKWILFPALYKHLWG